MIAASGGRADLVKRLLAPYPPQDAARVIVSKVDCTGSNALAHACTLTKLSVVQTLLRAVLISVEAGGWEFKPVEGGSDLVRLADLGLTMERACAFPLPAQHFLRTFLANPWRCFGIRKGGAFDSAEGEAEAAPPPQPQPQQQPQQQPRSLQPRPAAAAPPAAGTAASATALEEGSVEGWDVFAANEKLFGVKVGAMSKEDAESYGLREIRPEEFSPAQLAAAAAIEAEITASKRGKKKEAPEDE